jgi:hypothetical protein
LNSNFGNKPSTKQQNTDGNTGKTELNEKLGIYIEKLKYIKDTSN